MKVTKQKGKKAKTSLLKPLIYITRIDRFVSSTQDTYCYMPRFLYYFSVYVNLFKELFLFVAKAFCKTPALLLEFSNQKLDFSLKAFAKVIHLQPQSKCF